MKYIYIMANAFTALTGGDRHFIEIAKRWQGIDRAEVTLVIPKFAEEICNKEGLYANCIIIPPNAIEKLGIALTYILRTIFALIKIPKFEKETIVYSASDSLPDVFPSLIVKMLNRNAGWIACSFHLVPHYSKRQGSRIRNILSFYAQRFSICIMRFADLVVVDNSILKNELENMGMSGKRIFVSSMGVDKGYIDGIEKGNCLYDGCFVGRLHPAKGIFDLVNIWNEVVKKKKESRLVIIGKGDKDIVEELNGKINDFGLGKNIDLLGFLSNQDMFKVIKRSRIFVFPSHEEGWGIAIAEAMAAGLPVITYDLPALKEVFPRGTVKIELGNILNFAEEIISLLGNKERYEELQKEAIGIAASHDWDSVADKELGEILRIFNENK